LFLKTLELANAKDKEELLNLYDIAEFSEIKINSVIELFRKYEIPNLMEEEIKKYTLRAQNNIHNLSLHENKKKILINFADQLMQRTV